MRTYVHDDHKVQDLFAGIVNRLSGSGAQAEMIHGLLKDICEYFRFGCGLIYETDHTRTLILHEHYSAFDNRDQVQNALRLEDFLTPEEISELLDGHFVVVQHRADQPFGDNNFSRMFNASSVLAAPVVMTGGALVGLVAMVDRRREILIDEASVGAARTVLRLVANHVKTRTIQKRLTYARNSLTSILDHIGIDIYVNDFDTHEILFLNQSMAAPYGGPEKLIGRKCWEALYKDKSGECDFCPREKLIDEDGKPTQVYSWDYQRPFDGSWFRVFSSAFQWVDGRQAHAISSVDITDNKRKEAIINRLAFFDHLTQLPNRRKLVMDCEKSLSLLRESEGTACMLFFDLDNFKIINDTLGHQAGDELLSQIGRAMEKNPETQGRCYRLGGDEFVLYYENPPRTFIDRILDFLLTRFNQPWTLTNGPVICRTSIGVAYYPDDGKDAEALLYQADMAMYKAKEAGKHQAFFTTGETYVGPRKTGDQDVFDANGGSGHKEVK